MADIISPAEARARAYLGGLVHVHTRLSNYPGHFESDQSVASLVAALRSRGLLGTPDSPWQFLMINNHVANPTKPTPLGRLNPRRHLLMRKRWFGHVQGVPVWYGFEASILPGGGTDLASPLSHQAAMVIASCHVLPDDIQTNAAARTALLKQACQNTDVDVLGHPARYIEGLSGVDWAGIFAVAHRTGTAIEVNLNTFPEGHRDPARLQFWRMWLAELGASGARVTIGLDLHNHLQMERLVGAWQALGTHRPSVIGQCVEELEQAGIPPERVVTATITGFKKWLELPKSARQQGGV